MEKKAVDSSHPNFIMYSAHDTTVAVNLQTLGLYNDLLPPYAATVIYELHNVDDQYVVKVLIVTQLLSIILFSLYGAFS